MTVRSALVGPQQREQALVVERLAEVHEAAAAPGADRGAGGVGHPSVDGTSWRMDRRLGVLAFGDSITNGGGELQWGVALQSWALWTARGLGLPVHGLRGRRRDGRATSWREQIPRLPRALRASGRALRRRLPLRRRQRRARRRAGTRRLTSATSARRSGSCASAATACSSARSRSTSAGRGRARAVEQANAAIERAAAEHGALVVDLRDFGARNRVMVDAVHPTAFGQIAIAERALDVLAADGHAVRVAPAHADRVRDDALEAAARRRDLRLPPGSSRRWR